MSRYESLFFAFFHLGIVFKIIFVKSLHSWDLDLFFTVTATHTPHTHTHTHTHTEPPTHAPPPPPTHTHGLIAQSVRASEQNSVVVDSNPTQANFL